MSKRYTDQFIIGTIQESAENACLEISKNYALDRLAENGVVTTQEVETIYNLASKMITEGSEDLIPETLELPEDIEEPQIAEGEPEDLDISELDGIILPDAEGNEYIIQNGIIVPYMEEEVPAEGDPEEVPEEDPEEDPAGEVPGEGEPIPEEEEEEIGESAAAAAGENPEVIQENTETPEVIQENSFGYSKNSEVVSRLIDSINFK
jgi:hypothetical protein